LRGFDAARAEREVPGPAAGQARDRRDYHAHHPPSSLRARAAHTMLHIVLVHPEIAPNTGNVMRLAANTGCALHLVRPLGFVLDDARLRRAGLDYREYARVAVHDTLAACLATLQAPRVFALTTRGQTHPDQARFAAGDALLFGSESRGLPEEVLASVPAAQRLRLPMVPGSRSLNLSNAVAVTVYLAWRQLGYCGAG
jgi:tRNA (cytidine/uridine-2'-O-)-methyltransferase